MNKPSLHVPKLSKTILIVLGTLVVLTLLTAGLALTEAHKKAEEKQAAIAAQAAVASENARNKQVTDLKQQVTSLEADKTAACSQFKALSTAKATRALVVVPTAVHCN